MHISVTWDISAKGESWNSLNDKMRDALKPYSWVRPLSTFYIIKISGEHDRTRIKESMENIASSGTVKIHFLLSPIMSSGRYYGYLPKDMWDNINERTN